MGNLPIYHGSPEIVPNPVFGKGNIHNDYGQGFYCTRDLQMAKEWSCRGVLDGYANSYYLRDSHLRILNLNDGGFSILNWLAVLVENRMFRITSPTIRKGIGWLIDNFRPNLDDCDVVIGYRADDSYFSFARAFLRNEISIAQLSRSMRLGNLGEQVVLKSRRSFENLVFLGYEIAEGNEYFIRRKNRDEKARLAFQEELESDEKDGIFIRDLMNGGADVEDLRI